MKQGYLISRQYVQKLKKKKKEKKKGVNGAMVCARFFLKKILVLFLHKSPKCWLSK